MTTYAELTTQILDYTETTTDVLTSTRTDDFIEHTENRILREADLDAFKSHQYAALTSSSPFLSLPGGTDPDPTSLATIRTVHIWPASGTATRDFLEQRDISFMNEYWPVRTSTSTPKYWAWWDENSIYLAPLAVIVADVKDISEKSARAVVPLVVGVTFVNDPPPAV